jgi:hypothetical protein
MMRDSQYEEIRWKIEQRYKQRVGLIIHFAAFVISNLMFWGMWLFMTPASVAVSAPGAPVEAMPVDLGFPWPIFVTLGWGIGMVAHFLSYYYRYGGGASQREEAIKREVERELARREEDGYLEKPKNEQRMRLTEDGELEAVSDDEIKYKRGS